MKILIMLLAFAVCSINGRAADVTGTWKAEFDTQRGLQKYTFTLKQDGTRVTGKATGERAGEKREAELQEGKVDGDTITFVEPLRFQDNEISITYTGKISGDEIKFVRQVGDFGSSEATAKREGPAPTPGASLKISPDGRFFVQADGEPFFYLGDTAWGMFAHATREDINHYLDDRVKKQFTVIQAVAVLWDGTRRRNPYGHLPLEGGDPTKPNEAYFQHVDYAIDQAAERGLYIAVLPFWVKGFILDPNSQLLDPAKMRTFCEFLGKRYRDKPVIWVLGGDWPGKDTEELSDAMAAGLRGGDGGRNLMTYHPTGRQSSSFWFHDRPWLDFNFIQSGHFIHNNNYELVADDYAKSPAKPTMDSEPGYENITDRLIRDDPNATRISAWDVRRYGYLGVFAGAAGHAYGCGEVYEFWEPGRGRLPGWAAHLPWRESLNLPGAGQMKHLRVLIESRPMLKRIPDQSLIVGETFRTTERIQATRAQDGSYAFIYTAAGKPITVELNRLSGQTCRAHWYDPRTGASTLVGQFPRAGSREFVPPSNGTGNDWVLVLDDAGKAYSMPSASGVRGATNHHLNQ